jgi:WD40 repeat protein
MVRRIVRWFTVLSVCCFFTLLCAHAHPGHTAQPVDPLARYWQDLSSDDAALAYRAMWMLAAKPTEAVTLIERHLQPAQAPDMAQIEAWIVDLADAKFAVRAKATKALENQGELAEIPLLKVLAGKPDLETRQRVETLLEKLRSAPATGDKLATIRAVEVLEMMANQPAREHLRKLAAGFPRHRVTWEAQQSLQRLQQRPALAKVFPATDRDFPSFGAGDDELPPGAWGRLGSTLFRLQGPQLSNIRTAAFSADNQMLFSLHNNGLIVVWEAKSGKSLHKLDVNARCIAAAPSGTILAVGIGPPMTLTKKNGNRLVTATSDEQDQGEGEANAIILWDWRQNKEVARAGLPVGSLPLDMKFNLDGSQLVVHTADSDLRLLDAKTLKGTKVHRLGERADVLAYCADGKHVAIFQPNRVAVLWNLEKDSKHLLEPNSRPKMAYSPDGKFLATIALGGATDRIVIWDVATGKVSRECDSVAGYSIAALGYGGGCKTIIGLDWSKGTVVWDAPSGKVRTTLADSQGIPPATISLDSSRICGMTTTGLRVWDAATGRVIAGADGHGDAIRSVAFSPRGDSVATGGHDGCLFLWDPLTGKQMHRLLGPRHASAVAALAYSPDGRWLASSDLSAVVRVWEVGTGKGVHNLPGHEELAPRTGMRALLFSADAGHLWSWGDDRHMRKWDLKTGKMLTDRQTVLPRNGKGIDEDIRVREGYYSFGSGVFMPGEKLLATATLAGQLHFFDPNTGNLGLTTDLGARYPGGLAISPTGTHFATSGMDPTLAVGALASGKMIFTQSLPDKKWGRATDFAPDGRSVAVVAGSKFAIVEIATGKIRLTHDSQASDATRVAFGPGGRVLVTATEDTTALVWDLKLLATDSDKKKSEGKVHSP